MEVAVDKLIKYKRPTAALSCLYVILNLTKTLDTKFTVKALLSPESEKDQVLLNSYYLIEIIKALQEAKDISEDELISIEWSYLPFMNNYLQPKILESKLITEPSFFCEIIQIIYRSSKDKNKNKKKVSLKQKNLANNADILLSNWRTPPGNYSEKKQDNIISLNDWLIEVKNICIESGHLDIALFHVGKVLIHSPEDPSGLWIHKEAAEVLNAVDADDIRDGFRQAIYFSRGVYMVDPSGKPELDFADKYRKKASKVENAGFHRFAITLRDLSDTYKRNAGQ